MTVAQDKTGVGNGSPEWQTPPELFAWLHKRFQFDYDAFASHENHLCHYYSAIDGTYWCPYVAGHAHFAASYGTEDGIASTWEDLRVFMNPPYSRGLIEKCIEKAYNERNNAQIIVALIPASTETQWFQQFILPACHIEYLPGRVRFINPDTGRPGQSPPSGSVVAIFRQDYQ